MDNSLFVVNNIAKLHSTSDFSDMQFVFPSTSEKIPAHKLLLSSASPVFRAMLSGNWKENDIVEITDSSPGAFREFLEFIYLPKVTLTLANIEEVIRLCDKYEMSDSMVTCIIFLKKNLTEETILWVYQLAITNKCARLKKFCEQNIEHMIKDLLPSDKFLHCSHEVLDHILKLRTLDCDEVDLFDACIKWAKTSCESNNLDKKNSENLRKQLDSCIHSIRFVAMDDKQVNAIMMNPTFANIFSKEDLIDLWGRKLECKLFNNQPRMKPVHEWNDSDEILCKRHVKICSLYEDERLSDDVVEARQPTFFSTNKLVYLGAISFTKGLFQPSETNSCVKSIFNLKIFQHMSSDVDAISPKLEKLYEKENLCNEIGTFHIPIPIAIVPNKIFEIRLYPKENQGNYDCFFNMLGVRDAWKQELKNGIVITFHKKKDTESFYRGIVSELYFNSVE